MINQKELLRALPKVDECISLVNTFLKDEVPLSIVKKAVQEVIDKQREMILGGAADGLITDEAQWLVAFKRSIRERMTDKFRRVVNGTGVVIHTNLGRSVLSISATQKLKEAGGAYSNLEFNLETGKRGSRYSLVEDIICELTGAEAALVVNNNAAAVLIALDTLAKGKEVIVSRGQLVEIGGSFRIPDVMAKSGARLVEVGATNRTHRHDYEGAITPDTAMLLRVHTSNFRIIGFTSDVSAEDLVSIARANDLITMEDLGSGCLIDLSVYGFPKEPTVQEIVKSGVDVVTFSGDKLLGGPQAGIIVGSSDTIGRIKKNPLNRALRIDKFTLASLESVFREYYDVSTALKNIPTLAMLTISADILKKRARRLQRLLKAKVAEHCKVQVVSTQSRVGGGALPEVNIPSWAIHLEPAHQSVNHFEASLRRLPVPVIGRIEDERFLLDVRTIQEDEISEVAGILGDYFLKGEGLG